MPCHAQTRRTPTRPLRIKSGSFLLAMCSIVSAGLLAAVGRSARKLGNAEARAFRAGGCWLPWAADCGLRAVGRSARELWLAAARVFRASGCGFSSLKAFVNVKSACEGTQVLAAPPTVEGHGARVTAVESLWSTCGWRGAGVL